jgi:hypothetical protein
LLGDDVMADRETRDRLAARPDDPTSSDDLTARLRRFGHADPQGRLRGVWKVAPGRTLGTPPGH